MLIAAALAAALVPHILFSQDEAATAGPAQPVPGVSAETAGGTSSRSGEEDMFFLGDEDPAPLTGRSSAFAVIRMVLVLALSAALIYLVVFFLRRLSRPQTEQNPHLKLLASTHLGNGRYVHVVSVGKGAWLIGSGEGGVRHIADIADQEAVDAMMLDASRQSAETPGILPSFQAMLNRFSGAVSKAEQNRLKNLRERRERFKRF